VRKGRFRSRSWGLFYRGCSGIAGERFADR